MAVKAFLSSCLVFGLGLASAIPARPTTPTYVRRSPLNVTKGSSSGCTHGPTSRGCWNGDFSIDTDAESKWPNTGKTVHYALEITNQTLYPDGVAKDMLVINGQYPGPVLTAGEFLNISAMKGGD